MDIHETIASDPTVAHLHQSAEVFDPRTEYAFSYLQVNVCGGVEYAFSYLQVNLGGGAEYALSYLQVKT